MTATLPPRLAATRTPPIEVPPTPEGRQAVIGEAICAAVLALRAQLTDPDPEVVRLVAGMLLDLEKTRMRHHHPIAGTPESTPRPKTRCADGLPPLIPDEELPHDPTPTVPMPTMPLSAEDDLFDDDVPPPAPKATTPLTPAEILASPEHRATLRKLRVRLQTEVPDRDWSSDAAVADVMARADALRLLQANGR